MLLLPVGLYLGMFPGDESGQWVHEIRVGGEVHELTGSQFETWAAVRDHRATRELGPPARDDAQRLRHGGLLVPVDDPGFARAHRLMPLLLGLGHSRLTPGRFAIGLPGREMFSVTAQTFRAWASAAGSLEHACGDSLEVVLEELPALLRGGGAYLDPVPS